MNWIYMGGYGAYVWGAYGLTLVVFVMNYLIVKREKKQIQKRMNRFIQSKDHE